LKIRNRESQIEVSLRLRLTLLYSIIVGGILFILGAMVYLLINIFLLNQVDNMLTQVYRDVVVVTHVNSMGEIDSMNSPPLDITTNAYVQIWGRDGRLKSSSTNLAEPLDPAALQYDLPVYRDTHIQSVHLRVLTVPLVRGTKPVGVLQVGTNLTVLDEMRNSLSMIMLFSGLLAVLLAGMGSWLMLGRALSPLDVITETVDQINRADDLARRIPYQGSPVDEVGSLVESINQTFERLESLFTSQQRFLADVSHELRTPLTVVKGNVDLMRRMKTIDEESLNSIDQEAGRLTRLVGGLLLLAQAESGKLALNIKPIELDALLFEVFQEMNVLARGKIQLKMNEIDQVQINGDRDGLKQVLLNLIANAIQYTPQGGEVFISLAKVGQQARIIIRDTGPGIPAEDMPHIFERFYRAEKSRTRSKVGGFGLGLSIADWIVEQHGGQIKVESKEGKGTTFAIWLPLFTQAALTSVTSPVGQGIDKKKEQYQANGLRMQTGSGDGQKARNSTK
jgi:two-component system OmpR family sensor kinase